MPVESSKVNIPNGTAVLLVGAENMDQDVAIANANDTNPIYLDGNDQVSAATGFPLKKEEAISLTLGAGDKLYGIADAAGVIANVIVVTAD